MGAMKKKYITTLLTAGALALLTACSGSSNTASSTPTGTGDIPEGTAYTWETGTYPSDAPSLLTKEDPADKTGWYMGSKDEAANLQHQRNNFNVWQTIYSYKDSADPRGATVATVFYDDLSTCSLLSNGKLKSLAVYPNYVEWVMENNAPANGMPLYEYVFSDAGRTFTHPDNGKVKVNGDVLVGDKLENKAGYSVEDNLSENPSVEDAQIYSTDASSQVGVHAADAVNTPGRTATFFGNYTKDSNDELVPTGCATVYTALSEEAAGVYDQAKFTEAYEQAIAFAKEIEKMPVKKAVEQKQAP